MRQRAALEAEVAERAVHDSLEQVRITCSFARAERLLGREYHGRFLIELLQNAADAWREDARSATSGARVHISLTGDPALLVANEGAPVTAETVISSLGHIGASTKARGEAIGHKGIGFKSVLEISDAPEIYSGLQSADRLAIAFDPGVATSMVRDGSPRWNEYLSEVDNVDPADQRTWVPVLRYPTWVDDLPADVEALAADGYDTVVRLPLVARDGELDDTIAAVQRSIADISDEILLLLASFREVTITDEAQDSVSILMPQTRPDDGVGEHVEMLRDGAVSSSWRLYRSSTDETRTGLSSELTVGVRVDGSQVHDLGSDAGGAPFHLFFPTRIATGTPLLLHGYFEVDAARTGFYGGSEERNRTILDGLAALAATAIDDTVTQEPTLAVSMATALAGPVEPTDPLARTFREQLFERLDAVAWLPVRGAAGPRLARPAEALALPEFGPAVQEVFPAAYVERRVGRCLPVPDLPPQVLELVRSRQGDDAPGELAAVEDLLLPGDLDVWAGHGASQGFRALLDLLDAMRSLNRDATDELLARLRTDPASRLVPAVSAEGLELHPCADPAGGRSGEASRVIMARVRQAHGTPLSPPAAFDIDFLPDALLRSEDEVDRAKDLGVRQFTVDSILDRLGTINPAEQPEQILTFLWQLLDRERASSFGIRRSADTARMFDPVELFWCRPRRNLDQDTGAPRQRRERNLTTVHVPCRDGSWRPAGSVAFGADWAEWIEAHEVGAAADRQRRLQSLRALEQLAPGDDHLLAAPEHLTSLLKPSADDAGTAGDVDEVEDTTPVGPELRLLAFLLRMGVWQVLPVEAWDDLSTQGREPRPWPDASDEHREREVEQAGGWIFESRPERPHDNVWIGDDFRFRWSLESLAEQDAQRLAEALNLGLPLYRRLRHASAFCPRCRDDHGGHRTRHRSGPGDQFPSHLSIQLRHHRWVPVAREGELLPEPATPTSCWWGAEPIGASVRRQSPERFLDRTDPTLHVTEPLAHVAGLHTLATAPVGRLAHLLKALRHRHNDEDLGAELAASGLARQAFVGLHRRVYLRLADLGSADLDEVRTVVGTTGVLCERGHHLVYAPPPEARHDDGTHASHLRFFADELARVVLPREAAEAARQLGVPRLALTFDRRGSEDGDDVTGQLAEVFHDRIPELLAILVHHSQGTRTLEPTSLAFEQRARRLQNVKMRQLEELVLDVRVEGTDLQETVGEGANDDLFLEGPTSAEPVLYHDLTGPDWPDQLRRYLAPHVAALVENTAYEHTFEAFFNREGPTEREHFLLSLGIRPEDVDRLAERVGTVSDEARRRRQRWFAAMASTLGLATQPQQVDLDGVPELLKEAGLTAAVAELLHELGGGTKDRSDPSPDGAMATLVKCGVDLTDLDDTLREMGDEGLTLGVAGERFRMWRDTYRWPLVAVIAPRQSLDEARATVQELRYPSRLRLELDPSLRELLEPVVAVLARHDVQADPAQLATDPWGELARAAELGSVDQLRDAVTTYSDTEAWRRELRARAASWRGVLVDLAILAALPDDSTRAHIRKLDDAMQKKVPSGVDKPSELRAHLAALFPEPTALAVDLADELVDDVVGPRPTLELVGGIARRHGVPVARRGELAAARGSSRRRVERLRQRGAALDKAQVQPTVPVGLQTLAGQPVPTSRKRRDGRGAPRPVRRLKVDPSADRHKRRVGDDGERWALATTLAGLTDLDPHLRERTIDDLSAFLVRHFAGDAVDELVEYGVRARTVVDDDEEFLDHASRMLHVSAVSDAFGFDVLGWLATTNDEAPAAVCLEVKSTTGGGFHLSAGEWRRAEEFHEMGLGHRYAILAVVRSHTGEAPARMDLLPDPVALLETEHLTRTIEGYTLNYRIE